MSPPPTSDTVLMSGGSSSPPWRQRRLLAQELTPASTLPAASQAEVATLLPLMLATVGGPSLCHGGSRRNRIAR